jgi:hypothetical protein
MELRGVPIPLPRFQLGPLSKDLFKVRGYKSLQTFFPTLAKLFRMAKSNLQDEIWMDQKWRVQSIDCSGTAGACTVALSNNTDLSNAVVETRPAFLKVTHLLDPIQWIHGCYSLPKENGLPWHNRVWSKTSKTRQKLQDPGNQAYIETVASYALGRLHEGGISPHFNTFYGAFCAQADTYRYNLTDDFYSYRHERWFWRGYDQKLFAFHFANQIHPGEPVPEEIIQDFLDRLYSEGSEGSESSEESEASEASITNILENLSVEDVPEAASLKSADSMNDVGFAEGSDHEHSESTGVDMDEYAIYADIQNYPVMLILTEMNKSTMDSLFSDVGAAGAEPGTAEWDARWTAWIFQVLAALSCAQTILGFTHNDLHTNNVVWSETSEPYLYYRTKADNVFRIPTFGKIFKIIDFGRAIFTINSQIFISDDFKDDNDAAGQYVFSPLVSKFKKEIPPNPSFDMCRLAVSLLDGLFPKRPEPLEGGGILSKEPGLIMKETVSPLYNILWSWMIDDKGRSIFMNPDGSERFPDFDLYKHIAEHVHGAIPSRQFGKPIFDSFQISSKDIPEGAKVYSLFC